MAVWQVAGEVIGAKHRHHAVGAVAQYRFGAAHFFFALSGALVVRLNRERYLTNHCACFGACFPQWLAGFRGDGNGQVLAACGQYVDKALHQRLTLRKGRARPGRKRRTGCLHRRAYLTARGSRPLP